MRLRNSIIAMALLSSMSFAGGDIGGVTSFENDDYKRAESEVVPYVPTSTPELTEEEVVVTPVPTVEPTYIPEIEVTPIPTYIPTVEPTVAPTPEPTATVTPPTPAVMDKSLFSGIGGAYVGLAVSDMGVRADDRVNLFSSEKHQDLQKGLTFVAGYDFMKYLGAELRVALSLAGEGKGQDNLTEYGIYLKPQYPVPSLENLNIYGLLGYSFINMSDPVTEPFDGDNSGFSFGAGLNYGVTSNISVFTDVVNYLRNFGGTNSTWGANLGIRYNF